MSNPREVEPNVEALLNGEALGERHAVHESPQVELPVAENHVMCDLETLGTKAGCIVISIGMAKFDPHGNDTAESIRERGTLNIYPQRRSQELLGLGMDLSTVEWWVQQSDKAKEALGRPQTPLIEALDQCDRFLKGCKGLWSNGPSFDPPILRAVYEAARRVMPVNYWLDRDVRTMKFLADGQKFPDELFADLTAHDAEEDCIKQIISVQKWMRTAPRTIASRLSQIDG